MTLKCTVVEYNFNKHDIELRKYCKKVQYLRKCDSSALYTRQHITISPTSFHLSNVPNVAAD